LWIEFGCLGGAILLQVIRNAAATIMTKYTAGSSFVSEALAD
jgi:hypothetical protein